MTNATQGYPQVTSAAPGAPLESRLGDIYFFSVHMRGACSHESGVSRGPNACVLCYRTAVTLSRGLRTDLQDGSTHVLGNDVALFSKINRFQTPNRTRTDRISDCVSPTGEGEEGGGKKKQDRFDLRSHARVALLFPFDYFSQHDKYTRQVPRKI